MCESRETREHNDVRRKTPMELVNRSGGGRRRLDERAKSMRCLKPLMLGSNDFKDKLKSTGQADIGQVSQVK